MDLVCGWHSTHLKNMRKSIGMMKFPTEWKNKNVPNHQPENVRSLSKKRIPWDPMVKRYEKIWKGISLMSFSAIFFWGKWSLIISSLWWFSTTIFRQTQIVNGWLLKKMIHPRTIIKYRISIHLPSIHHQ